MCSRHASLRKTQPGARWHLPTNAGEFYAACNILWKSIHAQKNHFPDVGRDAIVWPVFQACNPFLSVHANILGGNAARLFKLPPHNEKQKENLRRFGNLTAAI